MQRETDSLKRFHTGPVFADREVSGNTVLPTNRLDTLRVFQLEMTFSSTPANNIKVAFGRDNRPADGKPAAFG